MTQINVPSLFSIYLLIILFSNQQVINQGQTDSTSSRISTAWLYLDLIMFQTGSQGDTSVEVQLVFIFQISERGSSGWSDFPPDQERGSVGKPLLFYGRSHEGEPLLTEQINNIVKRQNSMPFKSSLKIAVVYFFPF